MTYLGHMRYQREMLSRELAAASGMDAAIISGLERGRRRMNVEQAVKLSKALNVPWDVLLRNMRPDLFGGEQNDAG